MAAMSGHHKALESSPQSINELIFSSPTETVHNNTETTKATPVLIKIALNVNRRSQSDMTNPSKSPATNPPRTATFRVGEPPVPTVAQRKNISETKPMNKV